MRILIAAFGVIILISTALDAADLIAGSLGLPRQPISVS
jgi:hypothetical protein